MFKFIVPGTRGLLETIDGFTQLADVIGVISVCEALWLSHENILSQGSL